MNVNRRSFLKTAVGGSVLGSFAPGVSLNVLGANAKLNLGAVGVGGKGWSDLLETSAGQNVVAICDVDDTQLARAKARFPKARVYSDWRRLIEDREVEALTVSTPDHMHAPVAMSAMLQGKHVYCQKPLTHDVYEARQLAIAAEQQRVVTQMGTQHHSGTYFKTTVRLIREGVIGKVKGAHVWTDRPNGFWKQGHARPAGSHPVPDSLRWYLWLGTAPDRPYVRDVYHRFHWRAYWDFGTGALGDMGCHGINPVYHALGLKAPTWIDAESGPVNAETAPAWSKVTYHFPGTSYTTGDLDLVWWDGLRHPPLELLQAPPSFSMSKNGILFVGERGNLYVEYDRGPYLWPEGQFGDFEIEPEPAANHYQQWVEACKGNDIATCPFRYAGPLTEAVLLGNVAIRARRRIQWDSEALEVTNSSAAQQFIRREYREGWAVSGLSS